MVLDLVAVRMQRKDVKRLEKLKIHKTEPRWSVIERSIEQLYKQKNNSDEYDRLMKKTSN